ncbi:hypothetical protein [Enterococcus sp.]|uniref:hypothetical protein n=1 Tax=Enterococcus sp. TaxID=35783 RepID=UPI002FC8AB3F
MNHKEIRREQELRESFGKRDYVMRVEMANLQKKKFKSSKEVNELENKSMYEVCEEEVKKWIAETRKSGNVSVDTIFNFSYKDLISLEMEERKEKIKEYRKKICDAFDEENERFYYIWLTFNSEGMLIVVGMSSFWKNQLNKTGDLFNQLGRKSVTAQTTLELLSSITERVIINTEYNDEELNAFDKILEEYKELLDKINNKFVDYIDKALVIPVNPKLSSHKQTKALEKELGNQLSSTIPILNFYSH